MKITVLGAAREVTGSCFLIESANMRCLVDCGMVQGGRDAALRNRHPFAFDPGAIDFVLLTHAHIDHSGQLPKLTRAGFHGPIYATTATTELLEVMLPDSGHIQEADAERARRRPRRSRSKAGAALPLYTVDDAKECLQQLRSVSYDTELSPHPDVRCRFRDAGHILGSAIIEVWVTDSGETTKLVFSGDLGQPGRPILRDPTLVEDADVLIIESTYGDRAHKDQAATQDELIEIVEHTLHQRAGNVIVPAFAVGRTQEVLYYLHRLTMEGRLQDLNIFVDSPMATEATRITMGHLELFDEAAKRLVDWHALGNGLPYLHFVASAKDSMALNQVRSGAIIISASGMCEAGRIKHHLRHNLGRPECSVLITGFQAQGTLGRRLVDGAKRVRIFGEEIPVRASIHTVGGLSAHADQPALLAWAAAFRRPPRQTLVVHGEASVALAFAERLRAEHGWEVAVPELGQVVTLPVHGSRGGGHG
jgi:metallo-beta-lactamase family protein